MNRNDQLGGLHHRPKGQSANLPHGEIPALKDAVIEHCDFEPDLCRTQVRVMHFPQEGKVESLSATTIRQVGIELVRRKDGRAGGCGTTWIDITPDSAEGGRAALQKVSEFLHLDSDEIDDCLREDRENKIVERDNYLFVVSHCFSVDPEDKTKPHSHELHALISQQVIVTVHSDPIPELERTWSRISSGRMLNPESGATDRSPSGIYLALSQALMAANGPVVTSLKAGLNEMESEAQESNSAVGSVGQRLRPVICEILRMDTLLSDQADRSRALAHSDSPYLTKAARDGFEELIEITRDLVTDVSHQSQHVRNLLDAERLVVANKQNEISLKQNDIAIEQNEQTRMIGMIGSAIGVGCVITGIMGMNNKNLPMDQDWFLWAGVGAGVLVGAGLFVMAWRKGFLRSFKSPTASDTSSED